MRKTRINFEKDLLRKMVAMYCKGQKHSDPLCPDCRLILDYALQRLDDCQFGENKKFCSKCTVHCYKPAMRESIRKIMRYSGPRLLYCDPLAALRHILNK